MIKKNLSLKEIRKYQRNTLPLYTHFVIDPASRAIVYLILRLNLKFKPYFYTYLGLFIAIISSYLFLNQNYLSGAILFQISLFFDCVDGYIARIKNSGSLLGIISDGFADFLRIFLNLFAIYLSLNTEQKIFNFFTFYFIYVVFEDTINASLNECQKYFKTKNLKKNSFDRKLIKIKKKLENKKLRLVFFYYHERYFLIFFVGPVLGLQNLFVYSTIILSFFSLILKIFFDLACIKKN